jgi:DnaJ-class molecular chaperone
MDFNKNYYLILGLPNDCTQKEIKKCYYKLSFTHHPDKGGNALLFSEITEAYNVLSENREEFDKKSRFGQNYDESLEFLNYEFDHYKKGWDDTKLENWKKQNQLNIIVEIDEKTFTGQIEYERYVTCKSCNGSGKDISSKIEIKDENGNLLRFFEGDDGCDFCEGAGKNKFNLDCHFCGGRGKVGSNECLICLGEKRILGKQTLKGIKLSKKENSKKIEFMGNVSKDDKDIYGHVIIIKVADFQ